MTATRINPEYQEKPTVLFSGDTNDTVTLSQSAANFGYMRIFYRTNDYVHTSAVVYSPNGKQAILAAQHVTNAGSGVLMKARVVSISGTSITTVPTNRYAEGAIVDGNKVSGFQKSNNIYVTRVEAWN